MKSPIQALHIAPLVHSPLHSSLRHLLHLGRLVRFFLLGRRAVRHSLPGLVIAVLAVAACSMPGELLVATTRVGRLQGDRLHPWEQLVEVLARRTLLAGEKRIAQRQTRVLI